MARRKLNQLKVIVVQASVSTGKGRHRAVTSMGRLGQARPVSGGEMV